VGARRLLTINTVSSRPKAALYRLREDKTESPKLRAEASSASNDLHHAGPVPTLQRSQCSFEPAQRVAPIVPQTRLRDGVVLSRKGVSQHCRRVPKPVSLAESRFVLVLRFLGRWVPELRL